MVRTIIDVGEGKDSNGNVIPYDDPSHDLYRSKSHTERRIDQKLVMAEKEPETDDPVILGYYYFLLIDAEYKIFH